jgi:hypothetical protein
VTAISITAAAFEALAASLPDRDQADRRAPDGQGLAISSSWRAVTVVTTQAMRLQYVRDLICRKVEDLAINYEILRRSDQ